MKILLIPAKTNYPAPGPCFDIIGQGLPYIAGALKSAGYEVVGGTINYEWCHGGAPLALETMLRSNIEHHQPDMIGLSGLSADYLFIHDIVRMVRSMAPDVKILLGGGIITYDETYIFETLKPDYGLVGESEITVVKLLDAISAGTFLEDIPNLCFWDDANKPVYTTRNQVTVDLDLLPLPDYEPFQIEETFRLFNQADNFVYAHTRHHPRILPLSMGRSCPYSCSFCCHYQKQAYRSRTIESALDEIVYFYKKYKFNLLFVYDELFSIKPDRIKSFCEGILHIKQAYGMDFDWTCAIRVDCVDKHVLKTMKKAGCIFIGFGIESGSQTVLDSMKKNISVDDIERAIQLTEEAGIGVQGNFILGDIAETEDTINETKILYSKFSYMMLHFGYVTPYPGSMIFNFCMENRLIGDKSTYYKCVGQIGNRMVNMTRVSDEVLDRMTHPLLGSEYKDLPSTTIESFEEIGPCLSDRDAPYNMRRYDYEIQATCPHCFETNTYIYPLNFEKIASEKSVPHFCCQCHKRFRIDMEKIFSKMGVCDDNVLADYVYNGPHVSRKFTTYHGYNLIPHWCKIYAVPHSLGPVNPLVSKDMKNPEIIIADNEQDARHQIDKLNH